ncbi:MAG: hypothetical protein LC104_18235 [Bacteroidales bacterium]|nr:hypothetical protein [Bacteroidales bacterium]
MLHHEKRLPRNTTATIGFTLAVAAFVLANYGALLAPWHERAGDLLVPTALIPIVAYWTPFLLGLIAVGLGAVGLRAIERAQGRLGGDMPGVFAVMIGGLSAVIGAVQLFAFWIWPCVGNR